MTSTAPKSTPAPSKRHKRPPPPPKGQPKRRGLLSWLLRLSLTLTALAGGGVGALLWRYGRELPSLDAVDAYAPAQMSRVFDQKGEELGVFFESRRTLVPLSEVSPHLINAVLAAEDADFYTHGGLDPWGMLRAFYNSLRAGRLKGSGSTITQQTVKNVLLSQEKTLARKVKEVLLTRQLERRLNKDQILNMYLNTIYLGHGREGVEEAAQFYFGKPAHALALHEAALIAGVIQSPERHSPRRHPESALRRRRYVLNQMVDKGMISEGERDAAVALDLGLAPRPAPPPDSAQWWVQEVGGRVRDALGAERLKRGGLRLETTLRLDMQRAAQEALREGLRALDARQKLNGPKRRLKTEAERASWARAQVKGSGGEPPALGERVEGLVVGVEGSEARVRFGVGEALLHEEGLKRLKSPPAIGDVFTVIVSPSGARHPDLMRADLDLPQGAFVAIDPQTREVLAMVGGWSFNESAFNRATQARRQPGSTFKPFVYGAALESRQYTLATPLLDSPETWDLGEGKRWTPKNYSGENSDEVSFKQALAKSINSVAVRLTDAVGIDRVKDFARRAGISTPLADNLTVALGSSEVSLLELTNAYATFVAEGRYADPVLIVGVSDAAGQVSWPSPERGEPTITPEVAFLTTRLLREVVVAGSGYALKKSPGEPIGKTGTSNEAKDVWFVGATPNVVFGVWVGYDTPRPLGKKETGGGAAAPIAAAALKAWAAAGVQLGEWGAPPDGIEEVSVDPKSGLLAHEDTEDPTLEPFLIGTAPRSKAPRAGSEGEGADLFGLSSGAPSPAAPSPAAPSPPKTPSAARPSGDVTLDDLFSPSGD
jgi:penicillin-binding protein 1A